MLLIARCPRCGAREGAALRSVAISLALWCVLAVALAWVAWAMQKAMTARDDQTIVLGLAAGVIATLGVGIYRTAQRFMGSKNRVQFLASNKSDNKQGPYRSKV